MDDAGFVETVVMPVGAFVRHVPGGQMTDVAFAGLTAAGYLKAR